MPSTVILRRITPQQALEYKKQLDIDGFVVNKDYCWTYWPVKYNEWGSEFNEQSQAEFVFDDNKLASFYRLKWAK